MSEQPDQRTQGGAKEGYGTDFSAFDAITAPLRAKANEKWGAHSYRNWCPFRSPKGALMAFHMPSYADIRIVNLDSMEVVVDGEFYSHIHRDENGKLDYRHPDTVYASHTNHSVWVPSYVRGTYQFKDGETRPIIYNADDLDGTGNESVSDLQSIPLAFNAWTIWAADYEFYVDVLDLSKVDDGVVTLFDLGEAFRGLSIPISASHVRNFINARAEYWVRLANKETGTPSSLDENVTFDAQILAERHLGRLSMGSGKGFRNIYAEGDGQYPHAVTPWMEIRDRLKKGQPT